MSGERPCNDMELEFIMAATRQSKRFNPNTFTEKIVPILLVILLIALLTVFVVIGLSLAGVIPSA
jgi:hypothetical protein